jgi:hypothetical protein
MDEQREPASEKDFDRHAVPVGKSDSTRSRWNDRGFSWVELRLSAGGRPKAGAVGPLN